MLLQNETSDFIETFCTPSYILTHSGSKVGGQTIEGKRGYGRLQFAICIILVLMQRKLFCTDFCCSERVKVSKCMIHVSSELTYSVSIRKLQGIKVLR